MDLILNIDLFKPLLGSQYPHSYHLKEEEFLSEVVHELEICIQATAVDDSNNQI